MSDHNQNMPQSQPQMPDTASDKQVDLSRRRLAGASLGVSAIFTLASRPVLAGQCMAPSAACSGNLSHHGTPITCSGKSPGYWKEHPKSWPSGYEAGSCSSWNERNKPKYWSGGTLFHPFFAGSQFMADLDGKPFTNNTSLSMLQVMMLNDGSNPWRLTDQDNLGMHIVAAVLNAKAGYTPVLSETAVINMWKEWASKGYFEPTANVKWNSAQIVAYIKTTFR